MPTGRGTGDVRMAWKKGRKDNEYDVNFKAGWGRSNHRRLGSTIPPAPPHVSPSPLARFPPSPRFSHHTHTHTHPRGLWTLTLSNYRSTFSQVETRVLCYARQHPLTRLDLAPRGIRRGNVEKKKRKKKKRKNGRKKKEKRQRGARTRYEKREEAKAGRGREEREGKEAWKGAEKENQRERERGEWRIHRINRQR